MQSSYQTFVEPKAESDVQRSAPQSQPKKTFLALIASLALLSLLGFAAHQEKEEHQVAVKNLAMKKETLKAHATNPSQICESWAGGSALTAGNKLSFTVPMGDTLEISFSLSFSSEDLEKETEEGSLLYIGGGGEEMYPSIWLHREKQEEAELEVMFYDSTGTSNFKKYPSRSVEFDPTASSVEVKVVVHEDDFHIYIDGEEEDDDEIEEIYKPSGPTDFDVYAAAPTSFYTDSTTASATMSNLQICVTDAWIAPTESPTPSPTSVTPAPTTTPECQGFANSDGVPLPKVASDDPVFFADVTQNMELSFKLLIDEWNSGNVLKPILHVGQDSDEKAPAVYLPDHSEEKLYIGFSAEDKFKALSGFVIGAEYALRIVFSNEGKTAEIYVDQVLKATVSGGSDSLVTLREDVPVYLAPSFFGDGAPQVVLSDLEICSYSCYAQSGTVSVAQGNQVFGAIPVGGRVELSFKLTIGEGSEYGNVLQLGDEDHNEWPSVNFRPTDSGKGKLVIEFEQKDAQRYFPREVSVSTGTQYAVAITVDGQVATVSLDGSQQGEDIAIPVEFVPQVSTYPLFAGSSFAGSAADASLEELSVCTGPSQVRQCSTFPGSTVLYDGNLLFEAFVGDDFDLSFYVQKDKDQSTGTGNFFEIGDGAGTGSSSGDKVLRLAFASSDNLYFHNAVLGADKINEYKSNWLFDGYGFYRIDLKVRGLSYAFTVSPAGSSSSGSNSVTYTASGKPLPGVYGFYAPYSGKSSTGYVGNIVFCNLDAEQ